MSLDLRFVSPRLKDAHDLSLAVPGTYHSGKPVITIVSFDPIFTVIPSKQRPRKMALRGSDGIDHTFVLKGHEDIRQDERVMQLFGLVNTLLNNDTESFKRHLNIQKFPAIPLSQNSGLLGWVPNSDTLHNLIKEYRESRRILLNIEHRIMLQMAPDYDNLLCHGQHNWEGSLPRTLAQIKVIRVMARAKDKLHPVIGCHVNGRIHSWSWGSSSLEPDA
jgi:FKBP12-rapamycin complex-associated protein